MLAPFASVMLLAPSEPPWASWRWIASVDTRVLGAALVLGVVLGALGLWTGLRKEST